MIKFLRRNKDLSCEQIMEVLQGYLDGQVDENTAKRVAAHLDKCAMCGPEADLFVQIKDRLAISQQPVDPAVLASLRSYGQRVARGEFD